MVASDLFLQLSSLDKTKISIGDLFKQDGREHEAFKEESCCWHTCSYYIISLLTEVKQFQGFYACE